MDSRLPGELDFPLDRRIGKVTANAMEKQLGLKTVGDLLHHFPRRYLERGELTPIAEIPFDEDVTLIARVQSNNRRQMRARKGTIVEVVVTDDTDGSLGQLHLTFFNGFNASKELTVGTRAMFSGKVGAYRGQLQLTNPSYVLLDEDSVDEEEAKRPIPVYRASARVASPTIAKSVSMLLDNMEAARLRDPIPAAIRQRDRLPDITDAYNKIHRPNTMEEAYAARHRFRYQEALVLQTALARRRALTAEAEATARPAVPGGLLDRFDASLPFTLTRGQAEIGRDLSAELAGDHPMNRLLQGEVGSGKTLVALRAMLQVIDAGGQAALLAPTEVLASQHYESISAMLGPLGRGGQLDGDPDGTKVVLLTGSMNTAGRRTAMLDAASGAAGIIIGTHALLSEHVTFADLGLVVVDEQHRFGVEQRDVLRTKGHSTPHLLVMTATPIPRTVAMTVFGDLEVSTLTELPAGRAPISTYVSPLAEKPQWEQRIWARAREEIDAGRQVYVVCPKIGAKEEEPGSDLALFDPKEAAAGQERAQRQELTSVTELTEYLTTVPALADKIIAPLHGRLDPTEKHETMAAFNRGDIDVLVSTTVIEVGVDVPNASLMVIMDADRFGISQLHQLRGRVGRGGLPGTCLLVTQLEPGHPSRERLEAVAATTDGFELSRKDLELRREGDILGASQSGGRSTLKLLRAVQDEKLIEKARADAVALVAEDLDLREYPALDEAIEASLNPEAEAFLERG